MKLAEIFSDGMVLQRNEKIAVFGTGKGNGKIKFNGNITEFDSFDESFTVFLPPMAAGGPYDMEVTLDGKKTTIKNVLIGDVYLGCGQSNMAWYVKDSVDVEYCENSNIRYYEEPHNLWERDIDGERKWAEGVNEITGWLANTKENYGGFSAVAYSFASELSKNSDIPIGIVACNMPGSRIDSWTAPEIVNTPHYQKLVKIHSIDLEQYKFNQDNWLFRKKLLNIVPFSNSGVLWYQGESNSKYGECYNYAELLTTMMDNWDELWGKKLKYYCVQIQSIIEPFEFSFWPAVRHAVEEVSKNRKNVKMVTVVDTGDAAEIHPPHKKSVGEALAKAVRSESENIEYSGPIFERYEKTDDGITVYFTHAKGLCFRDDKVLPELRIKNAIVDLFVIDKNLNPYIADAKIVGETLHISWDKNIDAIAVTLGYQNIIKHNLYNGAGYMASPFKIIL